MRALSMLVLVATTGVWAGGCAARDAPPLASAVSSSLDGAPPGASDVCVIRPWRWDLSVRYATFDNGALVTTTEGPAYFCFVVEPGVHGLAIATTDTSLGVVPTSAETVITIVAGRRYFLHQDVRNVFGWVGNQLRWVDPDRAAELVEECKRDAAVSAVEMRNASQDDGEVARPL